MSLDAHQFDKMNLKSFTDEIRFLIETFHALNDDRKQIDRKQIDNGKSVYTRLRHFEERRLVRLAERIERLYRFRNFMAAKQYSMTPASVC